MIAIEWHKQWRRPRTRVLLAVLVALPVLLTTVIGLGHPSIAERVGNYGSVVTNTSGLTVPLIALSTMSLFLLPLAVSVLAGECVAGEASWGSLRYLLAAPGSRARVLAAKATVAGVLSVAAVIVTTAAALGAGLIAFGWHPLTVVDLHATTPFYVAFAKLAPATALARTVLAIAFSVAMLASTFSAALLCSTLTARPFAAVAGGIGLSLVSRALDNVPGLHALGNWLPITDHDTTLWTGFFAHRVQTAGVTRALVVQAAYGTVFLAAAGARFARADHLD